jgi:hypothetical protein
MGTWSSVRQTIAAVGHPVDLAVFGRSQVVKKGGDSLSDQNGAQRAVAAEIDQKSEDLGAKDN